MIKPYHVKQKYKIQGLKSISTTQQNYFSKPIPHKGTEGRLKTSGFLKA